MKEIFMSKPENDPKIEIPDNEVFYRFARSGGKGGQNVNKRDTKARAYWDFEGSHFFTAEQKAKIRKRWSGVKEAMSAEGDLTADSEQERSQLQNRMAAKNKLDEMAAEALKEKKERQAGEVPLSSKERRLEEKARRAKRLAERKIDY